MVNNSLLWLIHQSQRGFEMEYCAQLAFDNNNVHAFDDQLRSHGVDHVAVFEGLGCKAIRVKQLDDIQGALQKVRVMAAEHRVPVVFEIILERVSNIAMGVEIDKVNEFEDIECRHRDGLKGPELAGLLE